MRNNHRAAPENVFQTLGLTRGELDIVTRLLRQYLPDRPVWAFGSRTFGRARRRSDLDLAIGGLAPLSSAVRSELADAFDESDLPIEVDLVDLNEVTPEFRSRIESDFVALTLQDSQPLAHEPDRVHA